VEQSNKLTPRGNLPDMHEGTDTTEIWRLSEVNKKRLQMSQAYWNNATTSYPNVQVSYCTFIVHVS